MREIDSSTITEVVKKLFMSANYYLSSDIKSKLIEYSGIEISKVGKEILSQLIQNSEIAATQEIPICQDTGMSIVFIEIGQDVHVIGDNITDAINSGVRRAYDEGYLRKSVVRDPINRTNTGDNTPAVIYYDIVPGDTIKISVMPKGFGSENMSAVKMLTPSDGLEGMVEFVLDVVQKAGSNPCPPIVIGVGIGGTMDKAAYLSKKALLRPISKDNDDNFYAELEKRLLESINNLGIGPQGLGGITTALGLNIEVFPTHIAGLPVAVTISCHATRHAEEII